MKGISARYNMAVLFSITYCFIMILLTIAVAKKIIGVDTFVAVLGAFALVVREIVNDYFQRKDRVGGTEGTNPSQEPVNTVPIVEKKEGVI